jgi:hypothetical protein
LVCVEDKKVFPELSSKEMIINELKNFSNIRAHVNEFSCPLNFSKINESVILNMAKIAKSFA